MRIAAKKVPIRILWEGKYIKSTGQYEPNSIQVDDLKISRVHILGTVVDKYESPGSDYISLVVDDGTGQIRAKFFGEDTRFAGEVERGDLVRVIGKIRENEDERYLVGEIVKKLSDPNWEILWKLEVIKPFSELLNKLEKEKKGEGREGEKEGKKDLKEEEGNNEEDVEQDLLEIEEIEV